MHKLGNWSIKINYMLYFNKSSLSRQSSLSSYNTSRSWHTCWVGASSTRYVANGLRLRPRAVNSVKHLYLGTVQFTVGMVRPCSIATTTKYVHFVTDASCRVKVSPPCWLTTLIKAQPQRFCNCVPCPRSLCHVNQYFLSIIIITKQWSPRDTLLGSSDVKRELDIWLPLVEALTGSKN